MKYTDNNLNRREALATIGKAVAAGTVLIAASNKTLAQSTTLSFVIETYRAYVHSAPQYGWETRIYVYSSTGAPHAALFFMKEGQTLPANTVDTSTNSGKIYFPYSRLAEIREFLRNEKPIRVTIVGSNGIATLSNEENELVGDADI